MSERLVLDASAAVRVVMREPGAARILRALQTAELVITPSLFGVEVTNALWKYVGADRLAVDAAQERLRLAQQLVDVVATDSELLSEALDEAARRRHPVYDLVYLVLARRQAARLVSFDERLRKLARAMGVRVLTKR